MCSFCLFVRVLRFKCGSGQSKESGASLDVSALRTFTTPYRTEALVDGGALHATTATPWHSLSLPARRFVDEETAGLPRGKSAAWQL